eukprot:maker-scaffold5_size1054832-snap-gene-2.12 protein:Tk04027 transcript:maker-scaffold5_size1054832-snap-gene-2.12-mRNA-1 annotation:"PREDICTED: uncharacterized protein Rv1834/MT1882-like"
MGWLSKTSLLVVLLAVVIQCVLQFVPERPDLTLAELPEHLKSWYLSGQIHEVDGFQVFCRDQAPEQPKGTIILVHGFPTSSYDFHKSIEAFQADYRIVLCDHVGFGFSSKPKENFSYGMADLADITLMTWKHLGIASAHVVAHDMGDSVLTEILTRFQRKLLPQQFDNFFQSVTFTNGGMRFDLINYRVAQSLLTKPWIGPMLNRLQNRIPKEIRDVISFYQLRSLWSPSYMDTNDLTQDISDMQDLLSLNGGDKIIHQTISYLHDRSRFEGRWLQSLKKLEIPTLLFWGDSDAVSPMEIPKSLARDFIQPKVFEGKTLKDTGHFLMLENPHGFAQTILAFIGKHG